MKRRQFFKLGAAGAITTGLTPIVSNAACNENGPLADRSSDQWHNLGTGTSASPVRNKSVNYDVAIVGGGAAGMCAAIAAARNGAKTVLIQDRPVLGGNSSSEIRVHLNGVNHLKNGLPERETGIIEEILLHNRFDNPQESYPVWDHVLYDFVTREPNIDLMLNTQAIKAEMSGSKIISALCWQLTTETEYRVSADIFIDCSGDGLLAATAGAQYRTGREASAEFDEKYAPQEADGWQMGASILLEAKDMGRPMPYEPPSYVLIYDAENSHPERKINNVGEGYWWVELGSEYDIIADQEINRHKLMGYLHGVWDHIKNSGKFPESSHYALDWVGALPGRRESRRFVGDFVLSERDMTEQRQFKDAVAYGGWSLDEHNPGGIENLSEPPSYFHERFSEIYEIPLRSLYSKNVSNLMFAGRNVSQTHIALSSARIQATCALQGQAVGTAAVLCVRKGVLPRDIGRDHIEELQEQLLRDDAFIPRRPARDPNDLAKTASLIFASSTSTGDSTLLHDGWSRDINNETHHWQSNGLPADVQFEWQRPVSLSRVEIKCDTNVHRNIMMRKDSKVSKTFTNAIPQELLKSLSLEARIDGKWQELAALEKNRTRLIRFSFDKIRTTAIRIRLWETYGHENAKLFEVRCYEA